MNNDSQVYSPPESDLITEEQSSPKPTKLLIFSAAGFSLLYVIVNVISTLRHSDGIGSIAGATLACFIWPLIVVGVVSIWKKNRNSRTRIRAFLYATIFFLATNIAANILLPMYAEYNKQLKGDAASVAP